MVLAHFIEVVVVGIAVGFEKGSLGEEAATGVEVVVEVGFVFFVDNNVDGGAGEEERGERD